jgi:hypothetical protein
MVLNDETLMAFADGELGPVETGQVAAAIAADPELAARVAVFTKTRNAVAEAFALKPASQSADPLADRIRALSAAAATPPPAAQNVVAFPARRQVPLWQLPLAASIALVAGLGAGQFFMQPSSGGPVASAILGDPNILGALSSLPSGQRQGLESGAEMVVIASFANGDGDLCREFEYDQPNGATTVAVACRAAEEWQVQLAIAADAGEDGYAPASSLDTLDAWLTATDAAAPMSLEDETKALSDLATP